MASKNLRTLSFIGVTVLVAAAGLTALAGGAGHGPFAGHGFFNGHSAGHGGMAGHGPFAMHCQMMKLIDDLDLTAEQKAHVETIHQTIATQLEARHQHHGEHAQALISRLGQGPLTPEEVRPVIDSHLEQFRATAYSISDELVALVNSLDDTQRATLLAHLQEVHGAAAAEP